MLVDTTDDKKKIYAYNQPLSTNNKLKSLVFADEEGNENVYYGNQPFSQRFSSYKTNYTNGVYVIYSTSFTTVTAVAQEPDAHVKVTHPEGDVADPNTTGYQVHLPASNKNGRPIIITVTAENGAQKGGNNWVGGLVGSHQMVVIRQSKAEVAVSGLENVDWFVGFMLFPAQIED